MSIELQLDALCPPAPDQLVADLHAVGAQAFAGYVYRTLSGGTCSFSGAHVAALRAAGLTPVPIAVPGNSPPPPATILQAAAAFGFQSGIIWLDLESGSLPPSAWVQQFAQAALAAGYLPGAYGTGSTLGMYQPPRRWLADWTGQDGTNPGSWSPVPSSILGGGGAWQYAHDFGINGHTYDASVADPSIWEADMTGEQAAQLAAIFDILTDGGTNPPSNVWLVGFLLQLKAEIDDIKQKVDAGGGTGGQVSGSFTIQGSGTIS